MDREWHFVHKGEAKGPVSGKGLITLAADGLLTQDTLVWSGGEQWQRFGDVPELAEALRQAEADERGALLCRCCLVWAAALNLLLSALQARNAACQCFLALPPAAAKRRRLDGQRLAPSAEVQQEIPGWVQALDEPSQLVLFEKWVCWACWAGVRGESDVLTVPSWLCMVAA